MCVEVGVVCCVPSKININKTLKEKLEKATHFRL